MRIISLLPSVTEIIAALGKTDQLVGRSHECDFPDSVQSLPVCTEPKIDTEGTSAEIDKNIKALIKDGLSVYSVDEEKLAKLNPDIIITQDHCEACAASLEDVERATNEFLSGEVEIISVAPSNLSSVIKSIRIIAKAIHAEEEVQKLTVNMKERLQEIQDKVEPLRRPKLLAVEWLDPLMVAGNWVPELIQLAGGYPVLGKAGEHSDYMEWNTIRRVDPDIITIFPCGYSINKTLSEISYLSRLEGWNSMRAVQNKQIFIADGHHYFNRPGPRLVDSTQILAEILHPSLFREKSRHHHKGWINLAEQQFHQKIGKNE